eukprot:c12517_g1_i1 orf=45-230(-)
MCIFPSLLRSKCSSLRLKLDSGIENVFHLPLPPKNKFCRATLPEGLWGWSTFPIHKTAYEN